MKILSCSAAVAICTGLFTDAHALLLTDVHSASFNAGIADDSPLAGDFLKNYSRVVFIELPRFDAALGTLQSVQLSMTSAAFGNVITGDSDTDPDGIFQGNDASISFRMNTERRLHLFDPITSDVVLNSTVADSCSRSDSFFAGSISCGATATMGITPFNWDFPLSGVALDSFVGLDPLDLYASTIAQLFGACDSDDDGDSCNVFMLMQWAGDVSVSYSYLTSDTGGGNGGGSGGGNGGGNGGTQVPEPATFALLGAGLLALALTRRDRRATLPVSRA